MAYDLSGINSQRNAITQALMNVASPPPRTQMPGGGVGAPTQSPGSGMGVPTQNPIVPSGVGGMPGLTSPTQAPPPPGGMPGAMQPGMGGLMSQGVGQGAPLGPPQITPPPMGGMPIQPPGPVPGNIGVQPPQAGQVPGTQLPMMGR